MQKKLVVLFILVLLAFAGLTVRLGLLVHEKETKYQKQVLSQLKYDSTTLPYRRGDIVDAKGVKLATSEKVYNLVIDSAVMLDKEAYFEPTMEALAKYFPQLNMANIREYVKNHPKSSWYVPLRRLSYDEIEPFKEAQAEKNSNIKGIWFEEEYKRVYPGGSLAADVIGFARTDNVGQYGLEEYYNDTLNGSNGREYGYLNDDLALERTIKPATDGNTVHSTIDVNIQKIVEKVLNQFGDEHENEYREADGAENVGCIVMDPNTGEVLAMASYPGFDLNNPKDTQALIGAVEMEQIINANGYTEIRKTGKYITEARLAEMTEDEILLNLNNLWKNFCIANTYEPGSTMKPFTVAAALESGSISQQDTFVCEGYLEVGGFKIKCHGADGTLTLAKAVAKSCNVCLMKIARQMGADIFSKFQRDYNFGKKTNIDLAGEARTASLLRSAAEMDPTDLATYSFGQNFNVTMIQMAAGYCSLINGGYYYEPHVVSKITNSSGATVETFEPKLLKRTISESTSELIRSYCKEVVISGTGKTARPAGYLVAGKTGTAQTQPRGNGQYVVSFESFAPVDDPQVVVYVVVDRVNASKQDNARYATNMVREIYTELLPYMNIFMTEELTEAEKKELEERQLAITLEYGNPNKENGEEGENPLGPTPVWVTYPVDPVTGYLKNPNTGELIDAQTGEPVVEGAYDAIGADVPVPPEIQNPQE